MPLMVQTICPFPFLHVANLLPIHQLPVFSTLTFTITTTTSTTSLNRSIYIKTTCTIGKNALKWSLCFLCMNTHILSKETRHHDNMCSWCLGHSFLTSTEVSHFRLAHPFLTLLSSLTHLSLQQPLGFCPLFFRRIVNATSLEAFVCLYNSWSSIRVSSSVFLPLGTFRE